MVDYLYCTVQDVRNALTPKGVSDDSSTAASLEDWQITDAIKEAMGDVDTYLGAIYSIDQTSYTEDTDADPDTDDEEFLAAPGPVRGWTRDIAAYLATLTYKRNKDVTADDPVRQRYARVVSMLKDVRDGNITLNLPPLVDSDGSGAVTVVNQYEGHLFSPEDFGIGPGASVDVRPYRGSSGW